MDFEDTAEEAAFRLEARTWLKAHAREKEPGEVSTLRGFYDSDDLFVRQGRARPRAPYGGRGRTPMQQLIFRQEEARFDVPSGLYAVAIGMAGPTIIAHGTDAQRARSRPALLPG